MMPKRHIELARGVDDCRRKLWAPLPRPVQTPARSRNRPMSPPHKRLTRRTLVGTLAATLGAAALPPSVATAQAPLTSPQPPYSASQPTVQSGSQPAIGTAPENTAAPSDPNTFEKPKLRHREGTQVVARRGRIERRGERFVFLGVEPAVQWMVLENLALERILRVIETEESDNVEWTVDGMVTEFRGVNYLLLRRTVVRSAGERAAPRRLESLPPDATTLRGNGASSTRR
jgi:hypothetical protein